MNRRILLSLLLLAGSALAADAVSGTWKIDGDVQGNAVNESCTIKEDGGKVTGTCKGVAGSDKNWDVTGTFAEGKLTFQHGGEYNGDALTIVYTGTVDDKGVLKGTIDVKPFDVSGDFTAKKE